MRAKHAIEATPARGIHRFGRGRVGSWWKEPPAIGTSAPLSCGGRRGIGPIPCLLRVSEAHINAVVRPSVPALAPRVVEPSGRYHPHDGIGRTMPLGLLLELKLRHF